MRVQRTLMGICLSDNADSLQRLGRCKLTVVPFVLMTQIARITNLSTNESQSCNSKFNSFPADRLLGSKCRCPDIPNTGECRLPVLLSLYRTKTRFNGNDWIQSDSWRIKYDRSLYNKNLHPNPLLTNSHCTLTSLHKLSAKTHTFNTHCKFLFLTIQSETAFGRRYARRNQARGINKQVVNAKMIWMR